MRGPGSDKGERDLVNRKQEEEKNEQKENIETTKQVPKNPVRNRVLMRILALDLGIKTGWALYRDGAIESGWKEFKVERGESPGMRFLEFRRWLESWLGELCYDNFAHTKIYSGTILVIYEMPHLRGGAATDLLVGFATRIQEICSVLQKSGFNVQYTKLHTTTLKKYATGSGKADKTEMMRLAKERWPNQLVKDDNQADALWMMDWAVNHYQLKEEEKKDG